MLISAHSADDERDETCYATALYLIREAYDINRDKIFRDFYARLTAYPLE